MRQARPRYRASRFSSSLPTAVTARTGTPASAHGSSGSNVLRGISSLCVGPRKYPWSAASMTVWPSVGRMIRESRFWSPQVMFVPLDRLLAGVAFRDGLKAFASTTQLAESETVDRCNECGEEKHRHAGGWHDHVGPFDRWKKPGSDHQPSQGEARDSQEENESPCPGVGPSHLGCSPQRHIFKVDVPCPRKK